MNAPKQTKVLVDPLEEGRLAVLQRFKVEDIQFLGRQDLLAAKNLAGHGDVWEHWLTSVAISPGVGNRLRDIDLSRRLRTYVAKEEIATPVDLLVDEGVQALNRLALLMCLTPTGWRGQGRPRCLKPCSLMQYLYQPWPRIVARAIYRKASDREASGLFCCLTDTDLLEFGGYKPTRVELARLDTLVARGLWHDAPPLPELKRTTDPAKKPEIRLPIVKPEPHLPLPDGWLADIGPRVLWVVQDLGPNLLRLLEAIPKDLKNINWSLTSQRIAYRIRSHILAHLTHDPWLDRAGRPLIPPFRLATAEGKHGADRFEWPPRTWEQITKLSVILQAAHLFITLLASAGRSGEIATLTRNCVSVARDGNEYMNGHTYKLADTLFGDARQWPAPDILRQSLGQQTRLAAAWDWLPNGLDDGLPASPRFGNALWVAIGGSVNAGNEVALNLNAALKSLAVRLDMDPAPGGKNVYSHRFRKSIGRLAGIALFNSPIVLKRLFGHKSIEMTLHYILCDPDVRAEAEKVLRELRIMHCAEALEEIHQALRDGQPLPGNGGPGAARLVTAVRMTDHDFAQFGRAWTEGSAYDLASLLTMRGQGWRLIQEGVVCFKAPGEDGLCQRKRSKGEPNTANCQPDCSNRIVFARRRRDCQLIVERYLHLARQARQDGQLLVLASVMENLLSELANFADLRERYSVDPEVQSLLKLVSEPEETEAAS